MPTRTGPGLDPKWYSEVFQFYWASQKMGVYYSTFAKEKIEINFHTVFDVITSHTPISALTSNFLFFRL